MKKGSEPVLRAVRDQALTACWKGVSRRGRASGCWTRVALTAFTLAWLANPALATPATADDRVGSHRASDPLRDAQETPGQSGQLRQVPAPVVSAELVPEPFVVESLGLSIHPPRTANTMLEAIEDDVHLLMVERSDPPRWRIRIQPLDSRVATPTPRTVVQDHLNRLESIGQRYTILANEPVRYGGVNGHLLVVEEPGADGDDVVNGWVILARGGLRFTVVTLNTDRSGIVGARPLLEATLASLTLQDGETLMAMRRQRLDAGATVIAGFTPDRLRAVVGHDQWHRIHRPADAGTPERELGSVRIRATAAPRGSVHLDRNPNHYSTPELEEGFLVTVTARLFLNESGTHRMDLDQRYWMSWDRTIETWSSRTVTTDRGRQRATSQTGVREPIRTGHPTSRLTVINDVQASPGAIAPLSWTVPTQTYLCQPEVILLGELLALLSTPTAADKDKSKPVPVAGEMAFHYFDARRDRLPQRIDMWRRLDGNGPGVWELTTMPALDEPRIVQVHDERGRRLRRIEPDGSIVERIDVNALRDIWRRKGLPLS